MVAVGYHMADDTSAIDLDAILRGLPCALLVLRPDAHFTIIAATDAFLDTTGTRRAELVGRGALETVGSTSSEAVRARLSDLRASLARVVATRIPDVMSIQRTTVRRPQPGQQSVERLWRPVNSPVLGPDGAVQYILHRLEDVTEVERFRSLEAFLDVDGVGEAESTQSRQRISLEHQQRIYEAALSNTPDLVYVFDLGHRFIYANEALLKMWGKTAEEALGKTCLELGYEPWHAEMHGREIDQVIATRQAIRGEVPFTGTEGRRIYDYIFVPVFGAEGEVVAVAGSTRDVTERQRAEQEIREQAARLREADRTKNEFLATLSHELRNPLGPLRNALAIVRLSDGRDGTTEAIHAMMERQVNHLVRLVDDLLEVTRITRGSLLLRKEQVEIATIVQNALETTAPLIEAAGHSVRVVLPEEKLWLEGDLVRLSQVVANLLDNAAKYTDSGGEITVEVAPESDGVVIAVQDNGAGLAEDEMSGLFEMFRRGGQAESRDRGGLGIGLALARRLTEMHGGRIEAASAGPCRGSTFSVYLPLLRRPPAGGVADES